MRGRTLEDAFVLDEAQNTTHAQMKMFLTRLGFGSKMVMLLVTKLKSIYLKVLKVDLRKRSVGYTTLKV